MDSETGLLLLTHRYLDPAMGRFLTRDPIGCEGGINLYAYVGNGVVNKADPSGLLCLHLPGGICIGSGCHGDPKCPPAKPGKPKPKPAPPVYPSPPPVPLPFPYQPPYIPNPGTGPVQGMCEVFCAALLCPGKYSFLVCSQWCRWICSQQCNPGMVGPAPAQCQRLSFEDCIDCCERAFPSEGFAQGTCIKGCAGR